MLCYHNDVRLLQLTCDCQEALYRIFTVSGSGAGCKRNWAQFSARTTKIQTQFSAQTTKNRAQFRAWTTKSLLHSNAQNLGTIQQANETRSGHNFVGDRWNGHKSASIVQCTVHRLSENTKTEIVLKKNNIFNSGGCKRVRAGRKRVRAGRSTLRNIPGWNSVIQLIIHKFNLCQIYQYHLIFYRY